MLTLPISTIKTEKHAGITSEVRTFVKVFEFDAHPSSHSKDAQAQTQKSNKVNSSINSVFWTSLYCCIICLAGHSDVVMGLVSMNREDLYERLKFLQNGD